MEQEAVSYKLINGDRLAHNIGKNVTLFGLLNEDGDVTLDTGKGIVNISGYQSIGIFPNNSRVAEIKGTVANENSIQFEAGYPIPSSADPDFDSFTQAVALADEADLL